MNCFGPQDFRPSEIKIFSSQENTFNSQNHVSCLEREGVYLRLRRERVGDFSEAEKCTDLGKTAPKN